MKYLFILFITFISTFAIGQDLFLPPLNAKVIDYVNRNIGKKVDKGECWDVAFRALEHANAKHEDTYDFGRPLRKGEVVYPGDIIQFENARIKMDLEMEDGYMVIDIPHHTAIVYEILSEMNFRVADQNNGVSGNKISINQMNLNDLEKGKYVIFRPEKK